MNTNKDRVISKIISMLDEVPDYKMGYVMAYIQGLMAEEEQQIYDDCFRLQYRAIID